ncbi:prepilin peptidase dependent protein A [Mesocricetibacter intestinalis]|uniref:Prepilin peptidase dependent protein A n=1 Tax=Mesocricetibacter intestinalis TaxID=1521930 RepID=A0A4R6VD26_9PAST|nr:type II secretion system protein [Mesocricetibacter intestinalis]TDQ59884.1 prepilin peptidase dependent protein A [Mesocricetibacter intestinalis]
MKKGFTLAEVLIVMLLISLTIVLFVPAWREHETRVMLEKEQHNLYLFLRRIQSLAENSGDIWLLIASRDIQARRWCLSAQSKTDLRCDCLNPTLCSRETEAYFYNPLFPHRIMLSAGRYYPREITRLNAVRDTSSSACFSLQTPMQRKVFSFFNVGSLKVKEGSVDSACIAEKGNHDISRP